MTNDQASTLRRMAQSSSPFPAGSSTVNAPDMSSHHVRSVAITSGKGGVGKTNFVVNLSLELAALNRKVTVLDADLALGNTDLLFGVNPKYNISHVLLGEKSLAEIVVETYRSVKLIPASSGVDALANLSFSEHSQLIADLESIEQESDFLLIDTAAGIAENVVGVLCAASEVIIVTNPEPASLVDSYATLKVLHRYAPTKRIWVVVNKVTGIGDAEEVFEQLRSVSGRFLNHPIEYLGNIPQDSSISTAVRQQLPVVRFAPEVPASRAFRLIAKNLDRTQSGTLDSSPSFWRSLFSFGLGLVSEGE